MFTRVHSVLFLLPELGYFLSRQGTVLAGWDGNNMTRGVAELHLP